MAWMSDAEYELRKDCMEKKITARSARSTRTHCGKSGAVKFPSDYMTEKEKKAMNGECKSYRMNDPIMYRELKKWPEEHQKTYIKLLRSKYNVPDCEIAKAMGVAQQTFSRYIKTLNMSLGKKAGGGARSWKGSDYERAFHAWWHGENEDIPVGEPEKNVEEAEIEVVEPKQFADEMNITKEQAIPQNDIRAAAELLNKTWTEMTEGDTCSSCDNRYHQMPVIPKNGTMRFEDNWADDALDTIRSILANEKVNLTISWELVGD